MNGKANTLPKSPKRFGRLDRVLLRDGLIRDDPRLPTFQSSVSSDSADSTKSSSSALEGSSALHNSLKEKTHTH